MPWRDYFVLWEEKWIGLECEKNNILSALSTSSSSTLAAGWWVTWYEIKRSPKASQLTKHFRTNTNTLLVYMRTLANISHLINVVLVQTAPRRPCVNVHLRFLLSLCPIHHFCQMLLLLLLAQSSLSMLIRCQDDKYDPDRLLLLLRPHSFYRDAIRWMFSARKTNITWKIGVKQEPHLCWINYKIILMPGRR